MFGVYILSVCVDAWCLHTEYFVGLDTVYMLGASHTHVSLHASCLHTFQRVYAGECMRMCVLCMRMYVQGETYTSCS